MLRQAALIDRLFRQRIIGLFFGVKKAARIKVIARKAANSPRIVYKTICQVAMNNPTPL